MNGDLVWTREAFQELDAHDPLASVRTEFALSDDLIYLDGNSLGPLPRSTITRLREVVEHEWGHDLVGSWSSAEWLGAPCRVGDKIAQLIGALPGEVVVADSTSVALFKALHAACAAQPGRKVILTEKENFPSDLHVAAAVASLADMTLRTVDRTELSSALDGDIAVLLLTHVDFRTGFMHDLRGLSQAAHGVGALALWDLSHSVGAVPLACNDDGADLAVGCGYKYLNGGPGAPGFIYARDTLQGELHNPIPGWMGHVSPFEFSPTHVPADGIRSFLTGTPPVLSLLALECSVDIWQGIDMVMVRHKSLHLTDLFIAGIENHCGQQFTLASPREPSRRGSQVSLKHPHAYGVIRALIDAGVVGDFRTPDLCRFGFAPLYTRFVDVFDAVERIVHVLESKAHLDPRFTTQAAVT